MTQKSLRLAGIVVAVVVEEHNFATRNRFGKNPHGCWPKQMTGGVLMI